ncbi:signal peptidase II [Rothia sp. P7208]|uniref:signal peptidase II n=1 Tax=Rothia sp. P7208 TaxID=3402660 RepID=UPI003AC5E5B2
MGKEHRMSKEQNHRAHSSGPSEPRPCVRTLSAFPKLIVVLMTVLIAYGADQGTKYIVETTMTLGEKIPVVPGVIRWYYILNSGAAFSLGTGYTMVFTLMMVVAVLVCLWCLVRAQSTVWVFSLALLLGGVLGNLTDRLLRPPGFGVGHVVDFISIGNFAIFNIADSCICIAMALIVLQNFRSIRLDGTYDYSQKKNSHTIEQESHESNA